MKYRDHRGSLQDSLKTTVELNDWDALVAHLQGIYARTDRVDKHSVEVKWYCYDERIGWDTHIVTIDGSAVGFTDGPLSNPYE